MLGEYDFFEATLQDATGVLPPKIPVVVSVPLLGRTRSRFTEEQIIGMLREQEAGMKTVDVCRKHGISEATFYKYKAKFGGMDVSDARKLKRLLAEAMLDNAMLKDVASKNGNARCTTGSCGSPVRSARREPASGVCGLRPDDADLREAMRKVAGERRCFGYRRIHLMLERQGIRMNQKKLRRLYREEKLHVRKRRGRK
ncbi:integrase catalytic region [Roseibium sp. TrichSKD4]|nr:integrase catalytic region [Roseibium sp. TrichSKD4]